MGRVAGHGFGSCRRHSDLAPRQPKPPRGLAVLGRQELVFACDRISRVGATDLRVWDSYALRLQAEVPCCTLEELCVVLSALRRANFSKRSLLNAICRRAKREVQLLSSGQTARVVSDLRKLRHLDGPLLLHLTNGLGGSMGELSAFDLALLLTAFAKTSVMDERRVAEVAGAFLERGHAACAPSVSMALSALSRLHPSGDQIAGRIVASVVPRRLCSFAARELVSVAFSLVSLDIPEADLLAMVLQRLVRYSSELEVREVHALRIVEKCVRLRTPLREQMRKSLEESRSASVRCAEALNGIENVTEKVKIVHVPMKSKLQDHLEWYLRQLELPFKSEEVVGPYQVDFALPQRIAIEVDGFTHFYQFSRRMTARSEMKRRVLRGMGWRVVSLPHFEWLPRNKNDRLKYLAEQIEMVSGTSMAKLRVSEKVSVKPPKRQRSRAPTFGQSGSAQ